MHADLNNEKFCQTLGRFEFPVPSHLLLPTQQETIEKHSCKFPPIINATSSFSPKTPIKKSSDGMCFPSWVTPAVNIAIMIRECIFVLGCFVPRQTNQGVGHLKGMGEANNFDWCSFNVTRVYFSTVSYQWARDDGICFHHSQEETTCMAATGAATANKEIGNNWRPYLVESPSTQKHYPFIIPPCLQGDCPLGTAQRPGSIIACLLENVSLYWRHPTVSMAEGWVDKNVWKYVLYACAIWMEPGRVHNTKTPYILATCSFPCGKTCISPPPNKASDIWATMFPRSCNSRSIHSSCRRPAWN